MSQDIETSVVIPTYNREKILYKCLKALDNQSYPAEKYEIIIINDNSTDNTENMLKNIDIKPQLVYRKQEHSGPAGARNTGLKLARGKYIVFIDDDIIVNPLFLEAHINKQKENDRIIVHGPVIYTNNLDNPTSEEMKITDFSRSYFATGNVSIKKEYLKKSGLFNEKFTEYGWEDLELGIRLKKLGLKAKRAPEAKGFHLKYSFSPDKIPAVLEKERQRGRMAVVYNNINSNWEVKLSTMYWLPFFALERILNIANWPKWKSTHKLVNHLHEKGHNKTRNFIVFFMKQRAYFNGMRKGPDSQSDTKI
ncbi:MAG: glycosyltransferase family 2 protein [Halanaerobiaceae bacterium]